MQNILFKLLFLLIFTSCSTMKSGQYVYVETPSEIKKVTKNYGVTIDELKLANPGKNFQGREWIFIPSKVGIAYFLNDTYVVEDYRGLGTGRF